MIGGGIYGAWIACDAARRGLSTALVEAKDWASGTSSASSKLVHGGLRYLEHLEIGLVRESLTERRRLAHIAPHRVRPLRFLLPVWNASSVARMRLAAGLGLYDLLAGFRQPVRRHRRRAPGKLRSRFPWIREEGLQTCFDYGDCQEDDARLTLDVVAAAQAAGAACANHVVADTLLEDGERILGARLRDTATGSRLELRCRTTVCAAGPWSGAFAYGSRAEIERVRGAHLILPAIPGCDHAFILAAPQDGRAFFVIPWYHRSLVGTTESAVGAEAYATVEDPSVDSRVASETERDYLLHAVAASFPGLRWKAEDVIGSFAGVRSLRRAPRARLSDVSRDFELLAPRPGLWLPLGGKLTTARAEASRVVDVLLKALGHPHVDCDTDATPLPAAPAQPFVDWCASQTEDLAGLGLEADVLASLLQRYGTRVSTIAALVRDDPRLAERLDPQLPFIRAELVVARRDEMALTVEDILRRRVPLEILARHGPAFERAQRWTTSLDA
ncbi:MAG TPA: glycerol-3-phosphate dehydrogenase/oxidase [Nevskiaceae bacterium]